MRPTSVPCPVPSTPDSQHGSSWRRGTRRIETLLLLCTVFSLGCDAGAGSQQNQELASQQRALGTGTGLRARYYDNSNLTGLKLSRTEGPVNFTWGTGSPDPSIAADTFSARWSGSVEPLYSETYTFHTVTDDGVRLWVNGVLLIDDWTTHTATERSGTISLTAGQRYAIQLDYFENGSTASAKLSWSSPSQAKELIPASQLHDVPLEGAAPQLAGTFSAPASGATGQALDVSWTVTNLGGGAAQPSWYDAVYLSTDALPGGDTLLTSPMPAQTAALAAGASYTVTRSVTLPRVAPGSYHLIFKTDVEDYLHETDEADNTVIVPLTVLAADLEPTAFTAPARASNGERVTVSWTVQNKGPVTANGQWYTSGTDSYRSTDKVFISADPVWDAADALVGEVLRVNAPTASGASYTLQTSAHIPKVYAEGPAWLLVFTDANGDIVEESDANNTYAVPITIDRPDLVATGFTAPAEAAPGELMSLSWTARNDGTGTAHGQLYTSGTDSYRWHDRVYLSADAEWDAADTLVGEVVRVNAPVAAGASYTAAAKFQLPAAANGSWFLLAIVDKVGDINEQSETNNTFAVPLTIGRADFVVDAFTGPAAAANGERVALSWTVRNTGTHLAHGKLYTSGTDSYRWYDKIYLSTDATWDAADTFVGEVARANAPLAAGATYTTTATFQLPKVYAEGSVYLLVAADKNGDVSELSEDNNAFAIPLTILRSDLVVESFTAPAEAAPGELVSLSWAARNIGTGTAHGQWYTSGTDSYRWYDKVYLSVDASLDSGDIYVGEVSRINAPLAAGAGYTMSPTMQLPVVASGPWYLIAALDRNGDITEQSEENNTFAVPITIGRADLLVESFTGPAAAANGERVTLNWTVRNAGTNTASGKLYTSGTSSYRWYDRVYVSTDAVWDLTDIYIGEVARANAPLPIGASYAVSATLQLPKVYAEGTTHLILVTDKNGDVSELSEDNNSFAIPLTVLHSDLVAEAFTAPAEAAPGEIITLTSTVRNAGTGTAHGQLYTSGTASYRWYDRVYLSSDTVWDAADVYVGETVRSNAPLAAGATYSTTANMQLPASVADGAWSLIFVTDKHGDVNEQSEANNTFAVPLAIGRSDLVVDAFTGPANAANGERISLSWTVRNAGINTASGKLYTDGTDSYRWYDKVYLSTDATWDAADTFLGQVTRINAPLTSGATYTATATVQLPEVYAEGSVYLLVAADKNGDISEQLEENNTFAIPLTVLRSDLVAESFTAPAEAAPGELISLSWKASNIGTGTAHGQLYTSGTDSYRWYDKVYLSVDASLDSGDIYVGEVSRINAPLAAGASYTVSPTMQLPVVASGPWYLIAALDRNGDINEQSEANNTFAVPITIGRADLLVESLTGPAAAANGERVTLSWTVRNAGSNTASGKLYTSGTDSYRWYDRVYVSTDEVWDLTDIYIGEVARANAPLPIGASYAVTATFQLPKVYAEGTTHLIVVTDKNGDVSEQLEDNNSFAIPLTVLRSDLVAEAFTAPAEAAPGEIITLSSTVRNAGTGTAHGQLYTSGTDSYRWYDRVYLSSDTVWDAADVYVGETVRSNAPLAAGATYSTTANMQLPASVADGAWSLIFVTDKHGDVNELSEDNNTFAVPLTIGRSDLVVDAFTGPANAANGERISLSWTVRNAGINTASGKLYTSGTDSYRWYDKVFLSTDATWDATDTFLGEVARANAPLSAGTTYTATAAVQLPEVYAEGNAHLILITDKNGDVSEQLEENNTSVITLTVTRPDLALTAFTAPEASAPGELISFSWSASNAGTGTATGQWYTSGSDSYRWYDKVYLSADPVLDAADTLLGEVARANAPLAVAATYTASATFQLPTATAPGSYYFLAAIDRNGDVNELDEANNVSTPVPVSISRADLLADAFTAPTQASTGQPVALSWTVRNAGTGKANGRWYTSGSDSYRWYDKVYLSTDALLDASDLLVGEVARVSAPLASGTSYTATPSLAIPPAPAGTYFLLLKADANGDVSEDNEDNNVLAAAAPISLSAPDLTPVALEGPDSSITQVPVTLSWTVYNAGAGIAVPDWKDDLYLSMDGACCGDANDVKVTSVTRTPDLAPGASYTVAVTVELPKVPAGAYQLVLRTRSGTTMYDADGSNDTLSRPIIIHETTEEPIVSLDGLAGASLKSPRFSPDGNRLAIADGTQARVFELVTFTERGAFTHPAAIDTVTFSPTGDQVLSGAQDGSARSWDSLTFAPVMGFAATVGRNPAAWSVDGARVLVGNGLKPQLFDSITGELLQTFSGPTSTVMAVALSPDGTLAAAAGADKTARLWNTVTGALVRTLSGHTAQVNALAFSPDGEELLTASNDGTIRFWSVATGSELGRINQGSKVGDASWSSDGQYVVSCDESTVQPGLGYLWARPTLAGVRSFYHDHETECLDTTKTCGRANRTPGKMTGIALSPDRTMVVGTQPNGKVRIWPSGLPAITPDTTVSLVAGTPAPLTLRANRTYHFRFDAVAEGSVVVTMEGSASPDATFASNAGADPIAVQMYAKHGAAASLASHDHTARGYASLVRARLPIVLAQDGTYYVSLSAPFLTAGSITGSIVVEPHTFEVASVSPHRVGNAGTSTFAVKGTGLSDTVRVELVTPSGAAVASTRVLQLDTDTLGVTFNLAGAQTGGYALRVTDLGTGATRTLPSAVDVTAGTGARLRTWMEGPTAVRGSTVRPFKLRWKNEGDADLPAPILVLSSSDGQALLDANWVQHNAMQVMASGEGYPGDVLPPGAEGSFVFEHRFPNYSGNTTFQVGMASEDSGPFNWADLKPLLTPEEWVGDANWETLWADSTAALGYTRREVAASFREANRYSTKPAPIEAVMSWALEMKMQLHPLVYDPAEEPTASGALSARALDASDAPAMASWSLEDVKLLIPHEHDLRPGARTFVLSHGWNGKPQSLEGVARRLAADFPGANIVYVDWSALAKTGFLLNPIQKAIQASQRAGLAGARATKLLRDLGIVDNITHVTHSHGQFVAESIALRLGGSHKLIALDAASPIGHGFRWPDYDTAFGKGNAVQFVNGKAIFTDDIFPHRLIPRGFATDQYMFGSIKDVAGHNGAVRMAAQGKFNIDELFDLIKSGELDSRIGFRGSVIFFAADMLLCRGNDWCSFGLALAESVIFWNPTPILLWTVFKVLSMSPEEIRGPAPDGETVSRAAPWNYEVVFWNAANAAGPVQELVVIEYLDENLDWSSVDFGLVEYGGQVVPVPPEATTNWTFRDIPVNNGCTMTGTAEGELAVDITLDYDPQVGRIEWRLKVVDTALEDFPWDPYAGILPPPDEKVCGRGHVTYTVLPKSDAADGDTVSAKAAVIFDTNPANYTNTVTHVIGP